ncbi:MAG: ATP-grasp domain-containing protein [Candidatus Woesearchaeota archaeon]|nr:ATP-grasp domain-containing protein [Candidatus Woesearchaeota archaeon]
MKDIVLFPASFIGSMELQNCVKSIPADELLVVYRPQYVKTHKPEGHFIIDDFSDTHGLIQKIKEAAIGKNIVGIIAIDDEMQFRLSSEIAKALSIPFYGERSQDIASNKFFMRQAFDRAKVPSLRYQLIGEMEDVSLGYPNILKIMTGSGSEFLFKNDTREELAANIVKMRSLVNVDDSRLREMDTVFGKVDTRKKFLLEEFAQGDEYSLDFRFDGDVKLIRVVRKFTSGLTGYFAGFRLLNARSIETIFGKGNLEGMCRKIAAALEIDNGVCMVDFKYDGTLRVIETAMRPGLSTFIHLMNELYGYASIRVLHEMLMGRDFRFDIPEKEGFAYYLLADRPGRLKSISADVESLPGFICKKFYSKAGDMIEDHESDHTDYLLGYVLFEGDINLDSVKKKIHIEVVD